MLPYPTSQELLVFFLSTKRRGGYAQHIIVSGSEVALFLDKNYQKMINVYLDCAIWHSVGADTVTVTSNIPFQSLRCPHFRNVILEILEVSSCDLPASVHSRSAQTRADWPCAVAGELQEDTSRILRTTFLKSGRFSDQNDM